MVTDLIPATEPAKVIRPEAGARTCEPTAGCIVDAPVAAIRPHWRIFGDNRAIDRCHQAHRAQGESQQHLNPPEAEPTGAGLGRQGV